MDARAGERLALLGPLPQVTSALRSVGLHHHPHAGNAGDSHHIIGAELDPSQCVLHGRACARQIAPAAQKLSLECAKQPDPLGLGRGCDERLERLQSAGRRVLVAIAERLVGLAELTEDQQPPQQPRRRWSQMLARGPPVSSLERQLRDRQREPVVIRAQAGRGRTGPLVGDLERLAGSAGEVEHVGKVAVAVSHGVEVVCLPRDLDRPLHPDHPLVHLTESDHRHTQRVERLGLGRGVIHLDRQRQRLLRIPHGLPEAPAQKAGAGEPRQQPGPFQTAAVRRQQRQGALGRLHSLLATVERPLCPRQPAEERRIAAGVGGGI